MKVFKLNKDATAKDISIKSNNKKVGRISKLEISMDIKVNDIFSFT
jgi:hypothetical protein